MRAYMHTRIGKMALGCYKSIRGPYFFAFCDNRKNKFKYLLQTP
nr:MAG TPA: hypothetical protein [Caudoviricetes sp.]